MKKNKNLLFVTVLGIISLVLITVGVTFAFFNYAKDGTTDNTITTGSITFLYTEIDQVGAGISLTNAFPISDEVGKSQTGEGKVFDFKVTSTTMKESGISYEITARKKVEENMLDEEAVKLYLTKVSGNIEEEIILDNYSDLTQTSKVLANKHIEKTLHTSKVPANSSNYEQAYRLRMWIDDSVDFSPIKDQQGNDMYPYNNKTFTVTVNVYANAKVLTQDEIEEENMAIIESIETNDGVQFTKVEDQSYNYEATLPADTTETTLNIETNSPNASVSVEKLDSLQQMSTDKNYSIKRLSASKMVELSSGDNYFKVTVTSENKDVENEYVLKISVGNKGELLSNLIFESNPTIYEKPTLDKSSNNTSDVSGLYKSTATNFNGVEGIPTYYFRGNVENNYVDFAGFVWRIIRINEDGTIRLIIQDGINNTGVYDFNTDSNRFALDNNKYMYYSNSHAKTQLESWYQINITNKGYSDKVSSGDYFCEQSKVKALDSHTTAASTPLVYSNYTPNFKCEKDGNGYGIVDSNVGLITYDEVVYAGGYYAKSNDKYYLYNNSPSYCWIMSPSGVGSNYAYAWLMSRDAGLYVDGVYASYCLRPVINLKAETKVTGTGVSDDHWVVQ